jgi:hypothetical protein
MSGPLPFILRGSWSGSSATRSSRSVISPLLAFATYLVFYELATDLGARPRALVWTTIWWAANPYMLGVSVLVFTDMVAFLFAVIGVFAIRRRWPWLWAAAMAGALLSRVCMVFVVAAVVVWLVGRRTALTPPERRRFLWATIAGAVPVIAVVALWNWQLSPINALRSVYLSHPRKCHIEFVSLYSPW